jgi:hypothetical protein
LLNFQLDKLDSRHEDVLKFINMRMVCEMLHWDYIQYENNPRWFKVNIQNLLEAESEVREINKDG